MAYWIYVFAGVYLIVFGALSKDGFIAESDVYARPARTAVRAGPAGGKS
jgi:hypothetical protein